MQDTASWRGDWHYICITLSYVTDMIIVETSVEKIETSVKKIENIRNS